MKVMIFLLIGCLGGVLRGAGTYDPLHQPGFALRVGLRTSSVPLRMESAGGGDWQDLGHLRWQAFALALEGEIAGGLAGGFWLGPARISLSRTPAFPDLMLDQVDATFARNALAAGAWGRGDIWMPGDWTVSLLGLVERLQTPRARQNLASPETGPGYGETRMGFWHLALEGRAAWCAPLWGEPFAGLRLSLWRGRMEAWQAFHGAGSDAERRFRQRILPTVVLGSAFDWGRRLSARVTGTLWGEWSLTLEGRWVF